MTFTRSPGAKGKLDVHRGRSREERGTQEGREGGKREKGDRQVVRGSQDREWGLRLKFRQKDSLGFMLVSTSLFCYHLCQLGQDP
jgi:hypothetical protein